MKIISILLGLSTAAEQDKRAADAASETADWTRDPLAHPDLDAMSERELADLPFRPLGRRVEAVTVCAADAPG